MSEENLYTKILEWGYERVDEGVTFSEFDAFLAQTRVVIGDGRKQALFRDLFHNMEENLTLHAINEAMKSGGRFHLNIDAAFRHLERVELQEARAGSRKAMCIAIASLILAALIGVAQIGVAISGGLKMGG